MQHSPNVVSFVRLTTSNHSQLKQAIQHSLFLIDYKIPENIRNVTIKPNMCYYWDFSTGHTTDPKFVAALIDLIREQTSTDVNISLVESDASAMKCRFAFKMLGYEKLAQEKNVNLVNLSEDATEEAKISVNGHSFTLDLPRTITNADLRINVPKIKYMASTTISCAMKNVFGCNPKSKKYTYHPVLSEAIVAINKLMKFDLHVLDGIIVNGDNPFRLNLVMASQNVVAFDAAAATILSVNPKSVKHIILANREGLGNKVFFPKGEPLKTFANEFPKKTMTAKLSLLAYKIATRTGLLNKELV